MWGNLARFILKNRLILLIALTLATVFMAYHAFQVKLSYEFSRAIPLDNPKYKIYQSFRQKFGEDGNLLVVGVQTDQFFKAPFFNSYTALAETFKKIPAVENVLSVPGSTNLKKDSAAEKLLAVTIFESGRISQAALDSSASVFLSLPFYRGLLYNAETKTYLMGLSINKEVMNSKQRNDVVAAIVKAGDAFGKQNNIEMHYSGLPHIRTNMATKVASEMQWFLLGSILLSAVILLIFFRSLSATALSLGVVVIGVIWCLGTIEFLGYRITLLTALIPPLVVVIGIPNCIYFLNKYHTSYLDTGEKNKALVEMISRMGIVTLFCNIAA
ncbi:MAG: RND transporter, partial [Pedobacter sp.]